MKEVGFRFKNRDNLKIENKLILIGEDITNKDDLLAKHKRLNIDNDYLHYGILKVENMYYFFEVDNFVAEYKNIDGVDFLCPCCLESLFARTGWINRRSGKKVRDHLCHSKKDDESDCIFRSSYKSKELKKKYYSSEGFRHKYVKNYVSDIINNQGVAVAIPNSYRIIENKKEYSSKVEFDNVNINIVKAITEKKVLSKDEFTKGYIPDICATTDNGEDIYIEITDSSGKTVNEYSEIWKRLGCKVLEVKVCDFYEYGLEFVNLYNPIIEKSRSDYICSLERMSKQKDLWDKIYRSIKVYEFSESVSSEKVGNSWEYKDDNGVRIKTFWRSVELNGVYRNMKVTFDMVRYMWDEGLRVGKYRSTGV